MENTSGVIANFSGGNDLTFQEVAEALENLQEMTGGMAEIIPGVVTDDQMENRVQVILVITGLGATAVEQQSISENTSFIAKPEEQGIPIATQHQNHIAFEHSGYEIADASTNLDLPAFIRRRVR
jgi:cell division protein FtsZ